MAKTILFTLTIILALSCFQALGETKKLEDVQLFYNIFKDWISKYNKQYGIEELAVRFMHWKNNYDAVVEHNANDETVQLGMNSLADMSNEEFSALRLGFNPELRPKKVNGDSLLGSSETNTTLESLKLPTSVDWRSHGAVTSVKNQGQCGGCWSFSAAGALEGLNAIKNKKLENFSEQQMLDCSGSLGNNGCDGGLMTIAFDYTQKHGIQLAKGYEYTASVGDCKLDTSKVVFKNTGYAEVPANSFKALKAAVAKQPVSVGIEASSLTVQLFKSGVISRGCSTNLDHGVLVVGYDVARNGQEYWIVKNSWGPEWGLDGYFNIAMGSQNDGAGVCGINMMASYPTL